MKVEAMPGSHIHELALGRSELNLHGPDPLSAPVLQVEEQLLLELVLSAAERVQLSHLHPSVAVHLAHYQGLGGRRGS